jgi:hypothetical protein
MSLREKFIDWYQGEYIPPDNSGNSGLVFLIGHYKRHWSSRLVHTLVEFYLKEWKWLLPFLVALVALFFNSFKN